MKAITIRFGDSTFETIKTGSSERGPVGQLVHPRSGAHASGRNRGAARQEGLAAGPARGRVRLLRVRGLAATAALLVLAGSGSEIALAESGDVFVPCARFDDDGAHYRFAQEPRRCFIIGPTGPLSDSASIARVEWTSWGGGSARGSGYLQASHGDPPLRSQFILWRPRNDVCGRTIYTRLTVIHENGRHTLRIHPC